MSARGVPSWLVLRRDGALKIRSGGPRGAATLLVGTTSATAEQIGAALLSSESVAPSVHHYGMSSAKAERRGAVGYGGHMPMQRARWLVPVLRAAGIEVALADGLSLVGGARRGAGRPRTVGAVAQRVTVDLDARDAARLDAIRAARGLSTSDAVRAVIRDAAR